MTFRFSLAIVNRMAMSMAEQVSVEQDVESSGHIPRSGIAGPYGRFRFSI